MVMVILTTMMMMSLFEVHFNPYQIHHHRDHHHHSHLHPLLEVQCDCQHHHHHHYHSQKTDNFSGTGPIWRKKQNGPKENVIIFGWQWAGWGGSEKRIAKKLKIWNLKRKFEFSNWLLRQSHSHIGCIYMIIHLSEFSNVVSTFLPEQMHSHIDYICMAFLLVLSEFSNVFWFHQPD